ncbi:hypothetical protein MMC31_006824 [Peltigera leucophlebia]|nr:hypothetical protein [Peltigera leucophlebia]
MEPDWTNFTLFGGQLSGPDVFTTWNTKKVLDFLLKVKRSPEGYGITGEDHIKGVQEAHDKFLMKKLEVLDKFSPEIRLTC